MKTSRFYLILGALLLTTLCSFIGGFYKSEAVVYDEEARAKMTRFGTSWAKKNGMVFLKTALGSLVDSEEGTWCLNIASDRNMTIEEARGMVNELAASMWSFVNRDPVYKKSLKLNSEMLSKLSPHLTYDCIAFKIAFWDSNIDRPLYPNLAQIQLKEGKLLFFYADPQTQALKEPITEGVQAFTTE